MSFTSRPRQWRRGEKKARDFIAHIDPTNLFSLWGPIHYSFHDAANPFNWDYFKIPMEYTDDMMSEKGWGSMKEIVVDIPNLASQEHKLKVQPQPHKVVEGDAHTRHCCRNCGCKYGEDDCTVTRGIFKQEGKCGDMYTCDWGL